MIVIAGGGLAAQRCCETLRAAGDDRPVTILSAEPVRPYDRPPLSKDALAGEADVAFRPAEWYAEHGIELRLGAPAVGLDAGAPRGRGSRGGERVAYDDLLIATGARALMLPALAPFANVQALRTLADARAAARARSRPAARSPSSAPGLIGLEAAATAARAGIDVTVIEAAPRPLAGVLGPRCRRVADRAATAPRASRVRLGDHRRRARTATAPSRRSSSPTARACRATHVLVGRRRPPGGRLGRGQRPRPRRRSRSTREGRTGLPHVFAAGDATGGGHWEAAVARRRRRRRRPARPRRAAARAAAVLDRPARRAPRLRRRPARRRARSGDLAADTFELDHIRDGRVTAVLLADRPPSALRAARARVSDQSTIPERTAA